MEEASPAYNGSVATETRVSSTLNTNEVPARLPAHYLEKLHQWKSFGGPTIRDALKEALDLYVQVKAGVKPLVLPEKTKFLYEKIVSALQRKAEQGDQRYTEPDLTELYYRAVAETEAMPTIETYGKKLVIHAAPETRRKIETLIDGSGVELTKKAATILVSYIRWFELVHGKNFENAKKKGEPKDRF